MEQYHGTTILSVRRGSNVALGGDGQVTLGNIVIKSTARKIRRLYQEKILAGFAGGTADAFTLFERFEAKLEKHQGNLLSLEIAYNGTGSHGPKSAVLIIDTDEGVAIGASGNAFTYQISTILAPEPSSLVLLTIAGLFFGGLTWRRWAIRVR